MGTKTYATEIGIAAERFSAFVARVAKSPIEIQFGQAWGRLMFEETGAAPIFWHHALSIHKEAPPLTLSTALHREGPIDYFAVQAEIGRYKADFLIGRFAYHVCFEKRLAGDGVELLRKLPLIVVECDGHDFHERTKEQAAHDRSRDREMTLLGLKVMRFTGSEIFRDADACARSVFNLLEAMDREPIDFGPLAEGENA